MVLRAFFGYEIDLRPDDSARNGIGAYTVEEFARGDTVDFEFRFNEGYLGFTLKDQNLFFTAPIGSLPKIEDEEKAIMGAIQRPVGCKPLREIVNGKADVVLICDDLTRTTPQHRILPFLLKELNRAGIADSAISGIIALGTHREMRSEEIRKRFGDEATRRIRIENHDYRVEAVLTWGLRHGGRPFKLIRELTMHR